VLTFLVWVFLIESQAMPKTALVVDDSKSILSLMRKVLDVAGYNVITASAGDEGLQLLKSGKQVDIIITDLNMPNMDGITFIWEIRKLPQHMFTPICMLTTESEQVKLEAVNLYQSMHGSISPFSL